MSNTIIGIVHYADGHYGVSFPDFPGVASGGETLEQATQSARDGLYSMIDALAEDGIAMPRIRTWEEIKSDAEAVADMAGMLGIAPMTVDLPGKSVRLNITMDEGLISRIDRRANELGESRSSFLTQAARARLSA